MSTVTRAIIFDFDGVIVNSEPLHEAAIRGAVGRLGMTFTHEQYLGEYIGYDDRDCFAAIARSHRRTLSADDLGVLARAKHEAIQAEIRAGRAGAFPGVIELIRGCAERVPVAVCSGALRSEIEPVLNALDLFDIFKAIVTADDVARSKPDPACYVLTAQRLGVVPVQCVAIEDTPTGASAAKNAGMRVAGVCHTVRDSALIRVAHRVFASTREMSVDQLFAI